MTLCPATSGRANRYPTETNDEIAHAVPGFFVGRFDIRYADVEGFMAGEDLAIVELNGATAESTNIYDPSTSLFDAYLSLLKWDALTTRDASKKPYPADGSVR